MSQVKGQVIRQRQDRKCPWAAILITKISVADNRLGISSQCLTGGRLRVRNVICVVDHAIAAIQTSRLWPNQNTHESMPITNGCNFYYHKETDIQ